MSADPSDSSESEPDSCATCLFAKLLFIKRKVPEFLFFISQSFHINNFLSASSLSVVKCELCRCRPFIMVAYKDFLPELVK